MSHLGFSYRSSIKELMMNDKGQYKTAFRFPVYFEGEWKKWAYLGMFVVPMFLFYFCKKQTSAIFLLSIVGMVGLYGCFKNVFIPFLDYLIETRYINDPLKVVYLGMLRSDLSLMKSNVILLVVSAIILVSILVSSLKEPIDVMLAMISFVVINILLSLAVMFKFSTELSSRKRIYHSLDKIGYLKSELKKIMKKEVILLYGTIALLSLLYILNIFKVLFINQLLDGTLLSGMIVSFIVPLMFCGVMNYIYYAKVLMKEE